MQASPLVHHLRLVGLVIGFLLFVFSIARWVHYVSDVQTAQAGPLVARVHTGS